LFDLVCFLRQGPTRLALNSQFPCLCLQEKVF
jgi:hypothetical protein